MLATRFGFPISTTHGLVGATTGAGLLAAGPAVDLDALTSAFFIPLLASPLVAVGAAALLYSGLLRGRLWFGVEMDSCVCVAAPEPGRVGPGVSVAVMAHDLRWGPLMVGVGMAAGGLAGARRVAMTMGRRITSMNHGQGFAANVTTAVLVIGASRIGLPVSTTHVSVGALFGIGWVTGRADPEVARKVVLSWVVTLPCAAALAAATWRLVGP